MAAEWIDWRHSRTGQNNQDLASSIASTTHLGAALSSVEDFARATSTKVKSPTSKRSSSPLRALVGSLSSSFTHTAATATSQSVAAVAISNTAPATQRKELEHVVQGGDWLYSICRLHNVDLQSVLRANPGVCNPDKLPIGTKLKIPSTAMPSSGTNPSTSSPSSLMPKKQRMPRASPSAKPSSALALRNWFVNVGAAHATVEHLNLANILQFIFRKTRVHTVGAGDSLEYVASRYGTTVESIKKLNKIRDDVIIEGSVLYIDKPHVARDRGVPKWRLADVQERNATMEGIAIDSPHSSQTPIPGTASFHMLRLIRAQRPGCRLKTIRVRFGDTLADLAQDNGLSIRELQRLNNLRNDSIYEGDVLAVSDGPIDREVQQIRRGVRRTYRPLFSRLASSGSLGIGGPEMTPRTTSSVNVSPANLKLGAKLQGRWKRRKSFQAPHDRWLRFNSPLNDGFVSSPFGWRWGAFHEGVDLAADQGTPILAADRGVITYAGWSGGYGYLVTIQHDGGFATRYGHCCAIHSRVGQTVAKGQQVAAVGATGRATGPHLHFEVRKNGEALDPFKWVNL